MHDPITGGRYLQASADVERAAQLSRDGEPGKAYALLRAVLKDAERQARQGDPGAREFAAFFQCVFMGHTGDCNSSFACWPEEWTVEIMGRIKRIDRGG